MPLRRGVMASITSMAPLSVVRAKFLVGMANLDSEFTDIVASVQPDAVKARVRGTLRANAIVVDQRRVYPGEQLTGDVIHVDDVQTLLSNIKSYGGAIDLGTEVRLLDNRLRISAAVVDLGFIKWKPSTALEAKLKGDAYFNGYDVKEGDILEITFGQRTLKIKVLTVKDNVAKADAAAMYEVIED